MSTALAPVPDLPARLSLLPDERQLSTMLRLAEALHQSGLLPNTIRTPQAAFAVIQKGTELGIPPMLALSQIGVINGKPVAAAELMLALIYRDHGDAALVIDATDDQSCQVRYKRRGWSEPKRFAWTMEDARRAGLTSDTWRKYPAAMLRARCISAVARLAFPDTLGGLYGPEELGAAVDVTADGEVVVVDAPQSPVAAREPAPAPEDDADDVPSERAVLLGRARRYRARLRQLGAAVPEEDAEALSQMSDQALAVYVDDLAAQGRRLTAAGLTSEDRADRVTAWLQVFFGRTSGTWLAVDDDARHAWVSGLTGGEHQSLRTWFESFERPDQFQAVVRAAETDMVTAAPAPLFDEDAD